MPWYRTGTVTVANGSSAVAGAGTDFVSNTGAGEVFLGPDGRVYEIAAVVSATQLTILPVYQGVSAGGQAYGIQPTSSFARDLAISAAALIASFAAVRDGVGQGLIGDGTPSAPSLRFSADQDTGFFRNASDLAAIAAGGQTSATFGPSNVSTRNVQAGFGAGNLQGVVSLVSGQASPAVNRLLYGTDGTGYCFAIGKNQGGVATNIITIKDNSTVGINTDAPVSVLDVNGPVVTLGPKAAASGLGGNIRFRDDTATTRWFVGLLGTAGNQAFSIYNIATSAEAVRVDNAGNLLVGTSSGSCHTLRKGVSGYEGNTILSIGYGPGETAGFFAEAGAASSSTRATLKLNASASSGRSINAGGTINASGADYAEYIRKAAGCGAILKGDVCGIDRNGELEKTWVDAIRYVVKSTDPNLVGGDVWSAHLPPRPEAPVYEAPAYEGPDAPVRPKAPQPYTEPTITLPVRPFPHEGEDAEAFAERLAGYLVEQAAAMAEIRQAQEAQVAWSDAQVRFIDALGQYNVDLPAFEAAQRDHATAVAAAEAAHEAAMRDHATTLAAWEASLEAARQTVDRIAFSGQVPVNVDADTLAACEAALTDGVAVYLVAIARGAGIGVTAVREGDMTLPQYMRRVGCVWAIRDGRPWVDVQHG